MEEVKVSCKLKSIESFKKKFENNKEIKIKYEEFSKIFFVENFFFSNKIPFIEEKFDETIFEIIGNLFKNHLQEIEYYINTKGGSKIMEIDCETLQKNIKKTQELYLKLHQNYKKFHLIALNYETNTEKSIQFLNKIYPLFVELNKYTKKLQKEMIENLDKELKKLKQDDEKLIIESSMFN